MADLNKVFLMGNLTRDPEVRYTPSNTAVADLRMAINRTFKGSDGQQREDTCFVTVTAWGRQAETSGEYLKKGSPLLVEGRLKYDTWEKEGQKQSRLSVVAERVQFMGSPPRSNEYRDHHGDATGGGRDVESAPSRPEPGAELPGDDDDLPF